MDSDSLFGNCLQVSAFYSTDNTNLNRQVRPSRLNLGWKNVSDTPQSWDLLLRQAKLAIAAFQRGMRDPANYQSSVEEPNCLSLLGARFNSAFAAHAAAKSMSYLL